jgi:hypothetical protein
MAFAHWERARLFLVHQTMDRRNDAAGFTSCCGLASRIRPASHPASQPRTGTSLPGTLASPRTGLTTAGCPQLLVRLRHNNLLIVMAPELLDALPDRRLGGVRGVSACGTYAIPHALFRCALWGACSARDLWPSAGADRQFCVVRRLRRLDSRRVRL